MPFSFKSKGRVCHWKEPTHTSPLNAPTQSFCSINILSNIEGIDRAIDSNEACNIYKLNKQRIGEIIVSGSQNTVFGDSSQIELPNGLRSHGSEYEMDIPLIGYNVNNPKFEFNENKDIGKYIINEFEL